jgi:hypothetical protein
LAVGANHPNRAPKKTARTVRCAPFPEIELVGGTRIELVTPSMSRKCSTAELTARFTAAGAGEPRIVRESPAPDNMRQPDRE